MIKNKFIQLCKTRFSNFKYYYNLLFEDIKINNDSQSIFKYLKLPTSNFIIKRYIYKLIIQSNIYITFLFNKYLRLNKLTFFIKTFILYNIKVKRYKKLMINHFVFKKSVYFFIKHFYYLLFYTFILYNIKVKIKNNKNFINNRGNITINSKFNKKHNIYYNKRHYSICKKNKRPYSSINTKKERINSSINTKKERINYEGFYIFNFLFFLQNLTLLYFSCNIVMLRENGIDYPLLSYILYFLLLLIIIILFSKYVILPKYYYTFVIMLITLSNILLYSLFSMSLIYTFFLEWHFDLFLNHDLLFLKIPLLDCYIHKPFNLSHLTLSERQTLIICRLTWNSLDDFYNWVILEIGFVVPPEQWSEWYQMDNIKELLDSIDACFERNRSSVIKSRNLELLASESNSPWETRDYIMAIWITFEIFFILTLDVDFLISYAWTL